MPRAEQYTKNESDLYVDGLAEEGLDEGNPFSQNAADKPISDPDGAAAAALMSRHENGKDSDGKHNQAEVTQHRNQPRTTNIFLRQGDSPDASESEPKETNIDLAEPFERRKSLPSKHSRTEAQAAVDAIDDAADGKPSDPELGRLAKRPRRDSRALLIQPDDDAKEEDRKMRANMESRRGPAVDDDNAEHWDDGGEARQTAEDDFDRPTEVAPMPLMDKISQHKDHEPVPRDAADQDDDIETKRGDDYDVENYEEFEDDDENMEEPARDTVGNEESIIQEDELR